MPKAKRQGDLRIIVMLESDPRLLATKRTAPIGADDEFGAQHLATRQRDNRAALGRYDCRYVGLDRSKRGKFARAAFEGGEKVAVFDVVAEGLKANLFGVEGDFGCAPKPPGIVDNAHGTQGSGLCRAIVPGAESGERVKRAGEQGCGAVIRRGRAPADEHAVDAAGGEGNRCGEPGRPAA